MRALVSHQCVPGLIPGPGVICGLSLLLVLFFALTGFSLGVIAVSHKGGDIASNYICFLMSQQHGRDYSCIQKTTRHDGPHAANVTGSAYEAHIITLGTPVFPSPQKPTFPNSSSIWIYCQTHYHEPLAWVIAQALPVFDIKFAVTFFYIFTF